MEKKKVKCIEFSQKEYEDVINKGFYMIETYLEKF